MSELTALELAEERIRVAAEERSDQLSLSKIPLNTFPESLRELSTVRVIFARDCGLTELPSWIGEMRQLTALHLVNNQLCELPEELGNLTQLQELYLTGNLLRTLPTRLKHLERLRELYADFNLLESLPVELARLHNLEVLWLNSNQLTSFPPEMCELPSLKMLGLDENEIQEIPVNIANLSRLQKLQLCGNQIRELPEGLADLPQIRSLDLRNNALSSLPPNLQFCESLQELFLHGNTALDLPELILGPTPEEMRKSRMPATSPLTQCLYAATADEAARGRLCLETAMLVSESAQRNAQETELRLKQREEAQQSVDARLKSQATEAGEPRAHLQAPAQETVADAKSSAAVTTGNGQKKDSLKMPAVPEMPGSAGTHSHFLDRQVEKIPETRVTHNISMQGPKRVAPPRLSDLEKDGSDDQKSGWGKKFLGNLLGRKKDDNDGVIK